MATHDTPTSDSEDDAQGSAKQRATSRLGKRSRDGSLATVAGGATLLWAARTIRKNAGRGTLLALAGAALIGVGRRQRRGGRGEHAAETGITVSLDEDSGDEADGQDEKQVSDDAHVQSSGDLGAGRNADESESSSQSAGEAEDTNPRGVADDEALGQDDGDEFDFVEGEDPASHQEPHLEEVDQDPRVDDGDDAGEPTEIDLSEASMADEASEAAGPQPEQAFPAREGTDPEPESEKAPPRSNEEGVEPSTDADDEGGADENTDDESADAGDETTETSDESTATNGESGESS